MTKNKNCQTLQYGNKGSNMKSNTWKRFASPVECFTIQMFSVVRNMTTAQRNVRK